MISDERQKILARNLVNYSCKVGRGDKVWIDAFGADSALVAHLVREVYAVGGEPYVNIEDYRIKRELISGASDEMIKFWADLDADKMSKMQCYIGIRGGNNSYELSDVPSDRMNAYNKEYSKRVHHDIRVNKTRWVILRYPTEGMSQLAGMSTEAYEDFYFKVCNLDYQKMEDAMTPLVDIINRTDKVRVVGPGATDLSFSIKGIGGVKCSGHRNIPDGEVYTAPVRDSVNGVIEYNIPSIENSFRFENVKLTFKDGKIVDISANDVERATKIFDTDEGARYVGEFSFGLNPYITKGIGDILFDEKISGSIHFTPGACYTSAPNGNESAVHWDLVMAQTPEYGGGEIYLDGALVRKDGRFVLPELEGLNPENLV